MQSIFCCSTRDHRNTGLQDTVSQSHHTTSRSKGFLVGFFLAMEGLEQGQPLIPQWAGMESPSGVLPATLQSAPGQADHPTTLIRSISLL